MVVIVVLVVGWKYHGGGIVWEGGMEGEGTPYFWEYGREGWSSVWEGGMEHHTKQTLCGLFGMVQVRVHNPLFI